MSLIFAFETSCDETACALFDGEKMRLIGARVRSQWQRHAAYDGVVPELAARDHLAVVLVLADDLLTETGARADCVAYTRGPGLAAALLTGAATAQALAAAWGVPTVAVNHLEGHLLSPLLTRADLAFPYLCLLVSGGHTQLWRVDGFGQYARLGQTLDDAAGEAFDKSAVLLGLGYPGGARLEALAGGDDGGGDDIKLPSPAQSGFDFSFSGLKTAVKRAVGRYDAAALAAAFQHTVAAGLATQAQKAMRATGIKTLTAVGGVACNGTVARYLDECARAQDGIFIRPAPEHCSDNAAMIALAAAHQTPRSAGGFDIDPRWQPGG